MIRRPSSNRLRVWVLVVLILGVLVVPFGAGAAPSAISVITTNCGQLDTVEMGRIIAMELSISPLQNTPTSLQVQYLCEGDQVRIGASDPVTGKFLQRVVPLPVAGNKDNERTLALLASQLFVASWLELLLPDPPPATVPPADARMTSAAKAMAQSAVVHTAQPPKGQGNDTVVNMSAGLKLRSLGEATPLGAIGVSLEEVFHNGFVIQGAFSGEFGQAIRKTGEVAVAMASAGLGAGWRFLIAPPFAVQLSYVFSGAFVKLSGMPSADDVTGNSLGAFTFDNGLLVSPQLLLKKIVVAFDLGVGHMFASPIGKVDGGTDVTMGGFWVGVAFRIGVRFSD